MLVLASTVILGGEFHGTHGRLTALGAFRPRDGPPLLHCPVRRPFIPSKEVVTVCTAYINILRTVHFSRRVYLCVSYCSQNKHPLIP
jgi:hypothetical protein